MAGIHFPRMFGVFFAVLLAGCASPTGPAKPLDTFDLAVPAISRKEPQRNGIQILVAEPQALKALDSESIVVRSDGALEYLAGSQWGDRLPKIVQSRLIQAFENSGRFAGVGRPGEGLAIDFQVISDIRAFEIRAAGTKTANVEISVKLLNDRNGVVVASKVFKASVGAGSGAGAFVRALDAAFSEVAVAIVSWAAANS